MLSLPYTTCFLSWLDVDRIIYRLVGSWFQRIAARKSSFAMIADSSRSSCTPISDGSSRQCGVTRVTLGLALSIHDQCSIQRKSCPIMNSRPHKDCQLDNEFTFGGYVSWCHCWPDSNKTPHGLQCLPVTSAGSNTQLFRMQQVPSRRWVALYKPASTAVRASRRKSSTSSNAVKTSQRCNKDHSTKSLC